MAGAAAESAVVSAVSSRIGRVAVTRVTAGTVSGRVVVGMARLTGRVVTAGIDRMAVKAGG